MSNIDDVIKQINEEKAGVQKHINEIEAILNDATLTLDKKTELYLALGPKLAKFYSLLQKSSEQLIDALRVDPDAGNDDNFD